MLRGVMMFLLNALKTPDIVFFILMGAAVAIGIAIYFLIPIVKHKEFEERRENLKKREEVFRANLKNLKSENVVSENKKDTEEVALEKENLDKE